MINLIIYTDGGSRGNPGPAAVGAVIYRKNGQDDKDLELVKKHKECLGKKTNNEAEYQAIITALKTVKQVFGKGKTKDISIEFRCDSELVVKQLNGEYKLKDDKIKEFFIELWNLKTDFSEIKFNHILREKNQEADRLVNEALDGRGGGLF